MKEIKKCSISGIAFTLELDAWQNLNDYLASLDKAYGDTPDGGEIIADIEARIAELILSAQDNTKIVNLALIESIVAQLGSAEDISEESAVDDTTVKNQHGEPRIPRRLYRDMEHARLGGVCAGLAKYFDIEAGWIRRACGLPFLLCVLSWMPSMRWLGNLGGNLIWVEFVSYAVMWIAVPAARTARQKLEANGERITVKSIRDRSANGNSNDVDHKARPVIAEVVTVAGHILIFLLKMVAALIVFALVLVALALLIGLFTVLFTQNIFGEFAVVDNIFMTIGNLKWIVTLGVLVVLLPVLILLYVLLSLLFNFKLKKTALLVSFLLWVVTLIALPVTAIRSNLGNMRGAYSYRNEENLREQQLLQDSIDTAAENYRLPEADENITEEAEPEVEPEVEVED